MPIGQISGLLDGSAVVIAAGRSIVSIPSYRASGLAGLADSQWSALSEPSLTGDTALVDISALPDAPDGYAAEAFRVRVNNGDPVTLPLGNRLNKPRHIRIPANGMASVQMAIVWRDQNDRVTNVNSDWSAVKPVAPEMAAAPSIRITSTRTTATAPAGFVFSAEVDGMGVLDPSKELHWEWNYGDPGSVHKRMRPDFATVHGINANVSYDHVGAHTYERPGDYGVTLTVTDRAGNRFTSDPYIVTLEDPDVVFAGTRTICIAPSGTTTGGPDGARYVVSWGSAKSHYSTSSRVRLLLERGQTHPNINLDRPREMQIGAFGTGADPIIPERMFLQWHDGDEAGYAIWGVEFNDGYDPSAPPDFVPKNAIDISVQDLTVHDCRFSGFMTHISPGGPQRWVLSSTECTNWGNFAFFQNDAREHAIIGCTLAQNPMTLRVPGKAEGAAPFYADHGPYRTNRMNGDCAIVQSDLFSTNAWPGNSISTGFLSTQNTIQLCVRPNAVGEPGYAMNFSQCLSEGAAFYFGPTAGNDGTPAIDLKVSKSVHVIACGGMMGSGFGGVLFENNVVIMGAQRVEKNFSQYFVASDTFYPAPTTPMSSWKGVGRQRPNKGLSHEMPVIMRNNTIIDLREAGRVPGDMRIGRFEDFEDVRLTNNLIHAPDVPGFGPAGPLDMEPKFTPYYVGRLVPGESPDLQTEFSNAENGFVPVPLAGCPAIGAATDETALDDFSGRLRADILAPLSRSTVSEGAFEPALES
ncbi:MAG: PKD domain-containing protein [Paracoccaceae bacterium]